MTTLKPFVLFASVLILHACVQDLYGEDAPAPWQPKMAAANDDAENLLKLYKVPADLKVELFAAEPLLAQPVALCCDDKGRFFVAETWRFSDGIAGGGDKDFGALDMRGHMDWLDQDLNCHSPQEREAMLRRNLGDKAKRLEINSEIIRMVEDTQGTGKADKSTIFAEGFNHILDGVGAGVLAYRGSIFYTCIPNLWRLDDTKNAGKADRRTAIATGFGCRIAFLGHDLHGLAVGPDGKLYFSIGDRGYNVKVGGKQIDGHERGGVFRCNPDGSEFEIVASGLRNPQKLAFDKYGNLFTADNNADHGDSSRWVYIVEGGDSGWRGGFQFITQPNVLGTWTSEKMWYEFHEGQPAFIVPPIKQLGQGPSGVAYYPGTGQLPARYENHFFYCDYKGNGGVFSFSVKPKGAGFEYVEDADKEFFWKSYATDMVFGVDGAAYASVWVAGITKTGKGRIYRICDPKMKDDPAALETKKLILGGIEKQPSDALAKLLEHPDLRVRQRAQFALADRGAASVPLFVNALKSENQLARIHAIWGIGQVAHDTAFAGMTGEDRARNLAKPWDEKTLEPLLSLVNDNDAEVVAQAVKIMGDGRLSKAQDEFVKLLKHENLRVRFFAAYALGKLGNSDAINPLCALLAENADKDAFVRHAGVMALYWVAAKYPDLVLAKGDDASDSVRMAVLLVLRRMEDPRVAKFLKDKNPQLVLEAARAINDVPIAGAFAELAALTTSTLENAETEKKASGFPLLIRRALNANFRLGGAENAKALAVFAARKDAQTSLRVEALSMLADWAAPPVRDKIMNLARPLPPRDPAPAAAALKPFASQLLTDSSGKELPVAAAQAAAKLQLKDAVPELQDVFEDVKKSSDVRVAALNALFELKGEKLHDDVRLAVSGKDVNLKKAGSTLMAKLDPKDAIKTMSKILADEKTSVGEKQNAFTILGGMKTADSDAILSASMTSLMNGKIVPEAELDLLDAAQKSESKDVKVLLAKYTAALPRADHKSVQLSDYKAAMFGGDAEIGRKIFFESSTAQCTRCHKVDGKGGDVGPELRGVATRGTREYILESIVDPSAKIAKGFESVAIRTTDGKMISGILKGEDDKKVSLMPGDGKLVVIPKEDIAKRKNQEESTMPPMTSVLTKFEIRHLVEFLSTLK